MCIRDSISVISVDTTQIDSRKYTNQVIENPTSYGGYRKSSTVTHNRFILRKTVGGSEHTPISEEDYSTYNTYNADPSNSEAKTVLIGEVLKNHDRNIIPLFSQEEFKPLSNTLLELKTKEITKKGLKHSLSQVTELIGNLANVPLHSDYGRRMLKAGEGGLTYKQIQARNNETLTVNSKTNRELSKLTGSLLTMVDDLFPTRSTGQESTGSKAQWYKDLQIINAKLVDSDKNNSYTIERLKNLILGRSSGDDEKNTQSDFIKQLTALVDRAKDKQAEDPKGDNADQSKSDQTVKDTEKGTNALFSNNLAKHLSLIHISEPTRPY